MKVQTYCLWVGGIGTFLLLLATVVYTPDVPTTCKITDITDYTYVDSTKICDHCHVTLQIVSVEQSVNYDFSTCQDDDFRLTSEDPDKNFPIGKNVPCYANANKCSIYDENTINKSNSLAHVWWCIALILYASIVFVIIVTAIKIHFCKNRNRNRYHQIPRDEETANQTSMNTVDIQTVIYDSEQPGSNAKTNQFSIDV